MLKNIIYQSKKHVAYVILNRANANNTINQKMAYELRDVCMEVNQDDSIYVVVLTGAGESFCCGNEIEQFISTGKSKINPEEKRILIEDSRVVASIASISKPVIAAINGDALGQGLELALGCDLRVSSEKAHFSLPQIGMGLIPMDGGTQRLPRIIGRAKAFEMIFTGKMVGAQEALDIGLVNNVVAAENLPTRVETLAESIAGQGPVAVKMVKEAINRGVDVSLDEGLRLEVDLYALIQTTYDRKEGIKAFLQKRPPRFRGR